MKSSFAQSPLARLVLATMIAFSASAATAQVTVAGAPMYAEKDIIDNAVNSKDRTTLVAAVKAAGLVETLKGKGPFTVFAPTNVAFSALPAGTVDTLLKPENKPTLTAKTLMQQVSAGGGKAMLKTASGGSLTATSSCNTVTITDDKSGMSKVTIADALQSNGVIHVVDKVLLPN